MAYLLALIVIIVVGASAFVAFSSSTQNTDDCSLGPASPAAAPVPNYQYFVDYNTTSGAIIGVVTIPSCDIGGHLPSVAPSLIGQIAVLNLTSSPALSSMMPNGYLNAYYVNLRTVQLTIIPGVSFVDSYHALYNNQPITNGTKIPVPNS
ncbi:MAG: hypothetical protein ACRECH_09795 [Nitrososphaerales archaeon]